MLVFCGTDVEQDRGKLLCFPGIDVEQDRDKPLCLQTYMSNKLGVNAFDLWQRCRAGPA